MRGHRFAAGVVGLGGSLIVSGFFFLGPEHVVTIGVGQFRIFDGPRGLAMMAIGAAIVGVGVSVWIKSSYTVRVSDGTPRPRARTWPWSRKARDDDE